MKFRVERDALADAVAWTAKSLPSRPSVPVLAGVLLRVADGRLHVSGFDYEVSSQVTRRRAGRRRRRGAGLRPAARRDHQGAAGQAGRHRRGRRAPRAGLRQRPVHAADDAGRGLPDPAGRCPPAPAPSTRPTFAAAVAQVAIAAGRDETLPMMTGVRIELERHDPGDARHRPLPAGAARDRVAPGRPATSASTRWCRRARSHDTAKTLGPLGGEVTVALARGGAGEGMIGFAGGTRRTTSRLLDGANYPPVRSLFPDQHNAAGAGAVSPRSTEVVRRSRWSPSGPPRCG